MKMAVVSSGGLSIHLSVYKLCFVLKQTSKNHVMTDAEQICLYLYLTIKDLF